MTFIAFVLVALKVRVSSRSYISTSSNFISLLNTSFCSVINPRGYTFYYTEFWNYSYSTLVINSHKMLMLLYLILSVLISKSDFCVKMQELQKSRNNNHIDVRISQEISVNKYVYLGWNEFWYLFISSQFMLMTCVHKN